MDTLLALADADGTQLGDESQELEETPVLEDSQREPAEIQLVETQVQEEETPLKASLNARDPLLPDTGHAQMIEDSPSPQVESSTGASPETRDVEAERHIQFLLRAVKAKLKTLGLL